MNTGKRRTVSISDLIREKALLIGDGYRAKNTELGSTGLPFARAGNINGDFQFDVCDRFPADQLKKVGVKVSQPGDVVFTSKGTVGRFAFVTSEVERFVYSPQLCFWRSVDRDMIDPRFLYYWIQGEEAAEQIDALKCQTDMADYVSLTDQRLMTITLPEISEQRQIGRILGAIDGKIELNRRTNRTLSSLRDVLLPAALAGELQEVLHRSVG
ncbi:MAG: restriction endonuclease subunit S [Dokdonella sp.]|nr:restriction endonuclease subunit S [Dokdonella sp.]